MGHLAHNDPISVPTGGNSWACRTTWPAGSWRSPEFRTACSRPYWDELERGHKGFLGHLQLLAGDQLLEFLHQTLACVVGLFAIDQYIKAHKLIFVIGDQLLGTLSTASVNTSWLTGLAMV